jgi:hypothetical protein
MVLECHVVGTFARVLRGTLTVRKTRRSTKKQEKREERNRNKDKGTIKKRKQKKVAK